jgi:hypothetical protein
MGTHAQPTGLTQFLGPGWGAIHELASSTTRAGGSAPRKRDEPLAARNDAPLLDRAVVLGDAR